MKKWILVLVTVLGIFLGAALLLGSQVAVSYNTHIDLTTLYNAKVQSNEAEFDNMWKKITQEFHVAEAQKDAFRQIFGEYAQARTGKGGGSMMNWIKESVPNVDASIYKSVLNMIDSSRNSWTRNQNELVDISRQYNSFIGHFPNNIIAFVFHWQSITPKVITSTRTQNSFESGKDDDTTL